MNFEVVDLRQGDRFTVLEPLSGSFAGAEVTLLDVGLGGMQIAHPAPLRIGTRGKITFRHGDVVAAIAARVAWSHFEKTPTGMVYKSGLRIDSPDPQYALALHTFVRAGIVRQDTGSLERKRQRLIEREEARKSQVRMIPTSERPPA